MDENKFLTKRGELEKYVQTLNDIFPKTKNEFACNIVERFASERLLLLSLEVVLDLCSMLVQHFRLGPPSDEENILDLLSDQIQNVERIRELKKSRDLLVFSYSAIDDKTVFEIINQGRTDFDIVIQEFRKKV